MPRSPVSFGKTNGSNWVSVCERHCHGVQRKTCFFRCMVSLCLFSLWDRLAAFKWKQMIICDTHFLFFFLCVSVSPPQKCTHMNEHKWIHSVTGLHQKRKKKPHSISLCFCLWEQLNLSLRFYSGLTNREIRWSITSTDELYHHCWVCTFVCASVCTSVCTYLCSLGMLHSF